MKIIKKIKEKYNLNNIELLINATLICVIFAAIITSLYILFLNRTLWVDEAALAISLQQRNLINLTFGVLDWDQSAPIIYLYIVKIIITFLGDSEIMLRLLSVVSYVLILILSYKLSKDVFKLKYSLFPVAFIASMLFMLRYSNEFKPYMFDSLICLLAIYMYYLYNIEKIKLKTLVIVFMILIWASNPVCFFIGGILLYELIIAIKNKDYKYLKEVIIAIGCVLISFGIYYFYWLRGVATSEGMQKFWDFYNFPLIPTSMYDISKLAYFIEILLLPLGDPAILIAILAVISLIIGVNFEDKYKTTITFSLLILLFASYIHMFPVAQRLWVFIYPILVILAFDTLNKITGKKKLLTIAVVIISLILVFMNSGIRLLLFKNNIYMDRQEVNILFDYLEENIEDDEKIYLYYYAIPAFEYKYGKDVTEFGEHKNKVIYAEGVWLEGLSGIQPENIVSEDKLYIVTGQYSENSNPDMLQLAQKGYLELIITPYVTPLFYYTNDIKNVKTKVEYNLVETKEEDGKYKVVISIKNTGEAILNHFFENVYLSSRQDADIIGEMKKFIKQDEEIEITIDIDFKDKDEVELQLYNDGKYWFDELEIEPIKIKKDMF